MAKPKRGRSTAAIDDHVGARIRERRIMLGLTQQQLAEMIGVTYQQAHKYERGINRVSAGRLFEIARVLGVLAGPTLAAFSTPHSCGNRLHRYELIGGPACIEQRTAKFFRKRLRLIVDLK